MPQTVDSTELGRSRTPSKASSRFSGDEAFTTRIMIVQRHHSAFVATVVVPASPEKTETPDGLSTVATSIDVVPSKLTPSSHLRSRSLSSINDEGIVAADISAPPSQHSPSTTPNIRHAEQTAKHLHRKSRSSDFSFSAAVNDIKEIDALTAGVLPLLVPGLKLGNETGIQDWEEFPPL